MPLLLLFCILCLLTIRPSAGFAQHYQIKTYTEDQGLPSSVIRCLAQADDGTMWFGTRRGLTSYDGSNWKHYSIESGLTSPTILFLALDDSSHPWVLDSFGALMKLENRRFVYQGNLAVDSLGLMRVGGGTLLTTAQGPVLAITITGKLYIWDKGRLIGPDELPFEKDLQVRHVENFAGHLMISTDAGLYTLSADYKRILPVGDKPEFREPIRGFDVDSPSEMREGGQRLWFVTENAIFTMENGKARQLGTYPPFIFGGVRKLVQLCPDGHGGLVIGSFSDLAHMDATGRIKPLGLFNGMIANGANALMLDKEKNIWVGNDRGLSRIASFRFANYTAKDGMLSDEVTSIVKLKNGDMLLGQTGGVTRVHKGKFQAISFPVFAHSSIPSSLARTMDMELDPETGIVWIAAERLGMLQFNPADNSMIHMKRIGRGEVTCLQTLGNGRMLIGTGSGVGVLNLKNSSYTPMKELVDVPVRKIYQRPSDGTYFIATSSAGLLRWTPQGGLTFYKESSIPDARSLFNVIEDGSGTLFVGTLAGLYRLEGDSLAPVHFGTNSIQRPVYLFARDGSNLWIGTDAGMFRWDGYTMDHYTNFEGLVGNECNRDAGAFDDEGRFWIGTANGLSVYDPHFDQGSPAPPVAEITSIRADTTTFSVADRIVLGTGQNDLEVNYRAVTFRYENMVHYRYRLKGVHQNDVATFSSPITQAQFLNIPPGTYQFEVEARYGRGEWGPKTHSAEIVILPPYYEQNWFRLLVVFVLIALFIFIQRFLLSQRTARFLKSEVQVGREKLSRVVRNTRSLIVQADRSAIITYVNPDVHEILGYEPSEIVGQSYQKILHPDDHSEVANSLRKQMIELKPTVVIQCRLINREGVPRWYSFAINAEFAEGRISGITAIAQDITELRDLEDRLHHSQKMEAVGMLAGGLAHDFNNLLTAISGHTEIALLDNPGNEMLQKHLSEIQKASDSAASLIRQLLAFSRKQTLQPRNLDLNSIILDRITMLKRLIGEDIRLEVDLADLLWIVRADPGQLEQVIVNLSVNARDAMPNGGWLTLKTTNRTLEKETIHGIPQGDYVELSVSDTGEGIPPDEQDRIFEPFFTTKEKGRGTGLGLSTVYGIVSQSGGYVHLFSSVGKGSTFVIFLPRVDGQVQIVDDQKRENEMLRGVETVLVVEDEEAVRNLAIQLLQRQGYDVLSAANGEEALALLDGLEKPIVLLVTDVIMPRISGPELAEKVKARWPSIRVLFMSGYTSTYIENRGLMKEESRILIKPFRMEELATRVREVLDRES